MLTAAFCTDIPEFQDGRILEFNYARRFPGAAVIPAMADALRERGWNVVTGDQALKQVIDPELFVNIVDLGLIYGVDVRSREAQAGAEGEPSAPSYDVRVEMTMTSPMCPAGPQLVANSRQVVEAIEGVTAVDIKVVMDPPWTPDRMTEDARDQLGIF